ASGTITIHKLDEPNKIFRNRYWEQPDQYVMTKEEYDKFFPNDIYSDENIEAKWNKSQKVLDVQFNTKEEKKLKISELKNWTQGQYVLELKTKDKYGADVEVVKYFVLSDETSKQVPLNKTCWIEDIKIKAEPSESAKFSIGTAEENIRVLYEVEHDKKIVTKEWVELNKEKRIIEIPVEEKHRGNFFVHFTFVKNSRSFSTTKYVYVPWTNKQLKLEFETFRDKLAPGQEEQWKIKISGPEGERLAAEMVATLYDASLDVFRANSFYFSIYPSYYSQFNWYVAKGFEQTYSSLYQKDWNDWVSGVSRTYESLNYFGYYFGYYGVYYKGGIRYSKDVDMCYECGVVDMEEAPPPPPPTMTEKTETMKKLNGDETSGKKNGETVEQQPETGDYSGVQVRTNLNETAFFYPHLETDAEGKIIINFTIPEALTRWKFLSFAHTKDLKYGMLSGETVTQKDLMVFPNPPRFFRENDEIIFTAKVSNLSEGDLQGTAILQLFDALTMKPVDADFGNTKPEITFNVKKEQSEGFKWKLKIPEGVNAVTYRVIAKTDKFSDGEESTLPVLVNRMLVTESLPLPIRGKTTKEFKFTKLLENKSTTLKHFKYTLEFTSNPAWYAIQALPYMMEYPYECSEQTFNRLYANSIATHIANSSPKIKKVFEQWKTVDKDALLSNLEKNQELKSLLLEETPWVMQAQNETEQKKRVGLLFDLNMMAREKASALKKLFDMQLANGGFPWFPGDRDNRYITQYIVTGFARLGKLNIDYNTANMNVDDKLKKSVEYLDYWIVDDYKNLLKWKVDLEKDHLGYIQIQYLYARSFFPELKMSSETEKVFEYYKGQAKKYWLNKGSYMQGMICIALHRYDERNTANDIIKSLKERSQQNEELGMYWKDNAGGYYWYQAPIETQALLVEAFNEVAKDLESVDAMRVWLLKHKQTNSWKTTKATSDACYALLISGTDWLDTEPNIEIQVGKYTIDPMTDKNIKVESGTGYFKTSWDKGEITNDMGNIKVEKKNVGVSWGAVYWQYFEQLDKITPHETPLKLNKKVFVEKTSDTGPILLPVEKGTKLKPGDKLIVRIELRVDREMEFVHMKDMRAAGFEPLNVISRYKYQGGLGYYESTRDASTNFFISWLPKGTYVFEYPLRVFHEGDFSNGITTIQCMYAPEFTSHSEGIRITVGE
ncbi:MAG: hypothetical protein JW866_02695, partial [Ignavibacteriales bacterium]|nr:hypothetical protein [Ignavibacteriales bacterium]